MFETVQQVDGCVHDLPTLLQEVIPGLVERLRSESANSVPMTTFFGQGRGPATIAKELREAGCLKNATDFRGIYVLLEEGTPIYVGISRSVIQRLRTHVTGDTHNTASLAYRMAVDAQGAESRSRQEAMDDPTFRSAFDAKRRYLQGLTAAFVAVDNDLVLHVLEPCAALQFGTSKWNTFATH